MRYERKFRILGMSAAGVRSYMDMHPLGFYELFPDRIVTNIYLDTPDLDMFYENLHGDGDRQKIRIRWYGENRIQTANPVVEIKRKSNEVGDKSTFAIQEPLNTGDPPALRDFIERHCRFGLDLGPVLLNSYRRSYLETFDGRFRATIDREIKYRSFDFPSAEEGQFEHDNAVILEIKFDKKYDDAWKTCAQEIPFRVSRNSKYVIGVQMTI